MDRFVDQNITFTFHLHCGSDGFEEPKMLYVVYLDDGGSFATFWWKKLSRTRLHLSSLKRLAKISLSYSSFYVFQFTLTWSFDLSINNSGLI